MSTHQALARRWRPQSFDSFVGQPHAIKALRQSLERQNIHHAHLLTGTRGVGKTTIARVFAKGLSCTQGITPNPCGKCAHCEAITAGNYIDLIEIDAASRTKVEDTKELLSQVNYPPVQGRFKIYLIDEVHSLSANSFNALLKTLEEPPEHVKFILATTDPQKLPITILSRCLQLHLQHHKLDDIGQHLKHIVEDMGKSFEDEAIAQIADAASGSLRDALSLLEQALAAADDTVTNKVVSAMFGRADEKELLQLLSAIAQRNNAMITPILDKLAHATISYATILDQCLRILYQIMQLQVIPAENPTVSSRTHAYSEVAKHISAEQLQLYTHMIIRAKNDLDLYPSHEMGFNMLVIRMSTFKLDQTSLSDLIMQASGAPAADHSSPIANHQSQASDIAVSRTRAQDILKSPQNNTGTKSPSTSTTPPQKPSPAPNHSNQNTAPSPSKQPLSPGLPEWQAVLSHQLCIGMMKQVLQQSQCSIDAQHPDQWKILVDPSLGKLITPTFKERVASLCQSVLGKTVQLNFSVSDKKAISNPNPDTASTTPKQVPTSPQPQEKSPAPENAPLADNKQYNQFTEELNAAPIDH